MDLFDHKYKRQGPDLGGSAPPSGKHSSAIEISKQFTARSLTNRGPRIRASSEQWLPNIASAVNRPRSRVAVKTLFQQGQIGRPHNINGLDAQVRGWTSSS